MLTFIIYACFANCYFANDPCIETNPGPFSSQLERSTFHKLKDIYKDITQVSCHQLFLSSCDTPGVIPRGFRCGQLSVASCQPNDSLISALKSIDATSEREKVKLHIGHYDETIAALVEQKNEISAKLAEACPSRERFDQLIAELNEGMIYTRDKLMFRQTQKLNTLLDSELSRTEWLPDLHLTSIEKGFLTNNEYLCDRIIDASMKLLRRAYPHVFIQSFLLQHSLLTYSVSPTVHIHHIRGNNFVTTSTLGNPSSDNL